jgi:hypothetical protein
MQPIPVYQELAREMIAADTQRDAMFEAMDAMWQADWTLPKAVARLPWVHKVVSTDPHDAVRAGTRTLSSVAPRIKAFAPGAADDLPERIERALGWHFHQAARRRQADPLRDIVLSALLYDEVVAQVVYLPAQLRALAALGAPNATLSGALRYGPFALLTRNPRGVHVRYSEWMAEAVLLVQAAAARETAALWGAQNEALAALDPAEPVTVYDYMDRAARVVWAEADGSVIELIAEEHGLPFLPWAARVGGTSLHAERAHQRVPLLYSVYHAGQWGTQNVIETLLASEALAYASAPRLKVEGPSDSLQVDYGEPARPAYVPPGHALSEMQPPALDESLAFIAGRLGERIAKSTVPRVLQSGDFPAGTPFSTLNLATQAGLKALTPYKRLAEEALAEVFQQMLDWLRHSGAGLEGFGRGRGDAGRMYTVSAAELAATEVFIEVELTADLPTDRMARINAAAMAVRELGFSRQRALEQIGVDDPLEVIAEREREKLDELAFEVYRAEALSGATPEDSEAVEPGTGPGFDMSRGGTPARMLDPEGAGES